MGYFVQNFLPFDASSLANWIASSKPISDSLAASGWVQTSDTGQVNWGTVASVPLFASPAYEIWHPTDALQTGGTQFFLKVTYSGTNTGGTKGPLITYQLGTSTDGIGTLTGFTSTQFKSCNPAATGNGVAIPVYDCYFSGDIDRWGALMNRDSNSNQFTSCITIERTKNFDGTNNGDGICISCSGCSTLGAYGTSMITFGAGGITFNRSVTALSFYTFNDLANSAAVYYNNIPIAPIFPPPYNGRWGNALTTLGWVHNQDVPEGTFFTTTLYSAQRTYIATGTQQAFGNPSGNGRICFRYD